MIKKIYSYLEGDKIIWMIAIILSIASLMAVYSVSLIEAYGSRPTDPIFSLLKQLGILATGLFIMYLIHNIKYTQFSRIAQLVLYFGIVLLILTLLFGPDRHETKRWLSIPIIQMSFQTSDFAKIGLVLYLARVLTVKRNVLNDFKEIQYSILLPIVIVVGLIAKNDNSTAGIIMLIALLMMFFAGVSNKVLAKFVLILVSFFIVFQLAMTVISPEKNRVGTLTNRLTSFVVPHEKYEDTQKLQTAIVMGGLFGQKPGNSTQKTFLKNIESDYIYALLVEEYGILGGLVILLLYVILVYRGVRIAVRAPSTYSSLLAFGVTVMICFQAFIHMMVVVGLFPITGQPLPFVSMGGTSIWMSFTALGILLSVSKTIDNFNNKTKCKKPTE
jgi:cell division protein FtsW